MGARLEFEFVEIAAEVDGTGVGLSGFVARVVRGLDSRLGSESGAILWRRLCVAASPAIRAVLWPGGGPPAS